jgi:DNA polymerase sigma
MRTFAPAPVSGPVEMLFINGHPACKYDLNSQFLGKRRMQYNIGDAPLDTAPGMKDTLTNLQDTKLTAELTELYQRLLPTPDSERRRALFIAKIESILHKEWPGTQFKAHVFGSSGNMLYTSDSDGNSSLLAERS